MTGRSFDLCYTLLHVRFAAFPLGLHRREVHVYVQSFDGTCSGACGAALLYLTAFRWSH